MKNTIVMFSLFLASSFAFAAGPQSTASKKADKPLVRQSTMSLTTDSASETRGFGVDCEVDVTCSSGRQIWCRNSGVTGQYFSLCIKTEGSVGVVACAIDDGNGTITSFASDSCP